MRELRERAEPILKVVCVILAALVLYDVAGIFIRWNPFRGVTVPQLPTLAASTNKPAGGSHGTNLVTSATGKGKNGTPHLAGTNAATSMTGTNTNSVASAKLVLSGTNFVATTNFVAVTNLMTTATNANMNIVLRLETKLSETNSAASTNVASTGTTTNSIPLAVGTNTNSPVQTKPEAMTTNVGTNVITRQEMELSETNSASSTNAASTGTNLSLSAAATTTNAAPSSTSSNTNLSAPTDSQMVTTNAGTNVMARRETKLSGTNSVATTNAADKGTNVLLSSTGAGTNAAPGSKKKKASSAMPPEMAGMGFNPFGPPGKSSVELPPAVKSRISKITESEILGPVMHPLPQALLGIAGNFAFLRSASGQTGLVKEGDSLDDIKLLRIGVNRVLIEQNGEKQELTIFDGYGSDSLLQKNSTNENNHP